MLTELEKHTLRNEPAALFSHDGRLLWRSPFFSRAGGGRQDDQVLGTRWQEFIFQDDLPDLLAWMRGDEESCISFRCLAPGSGQTLRVWYQRVPCRGNVLVMVATAPIAPMPAPPCVAVEDDKPQEKR